MADFRATWFFNDAVDNVGWTENWWISATDAPSALAIVANYQVVRSNLLLDSSAITAIRICNVNAPRDSYYDPTGLPVAGTIARATYPLAGVWDCLLCRRDSALNNVLGHLFLHMVPAAIFTGRVYNPGAVSGVGWIAKFAAFVAEVTGGGYLLRTNPAGGPITYPVTNVFLGLRRSERKLGRPFDALRGRRAVA